MGELKPLEPVDHRHMPRVRWRVAPGRAADRRRSRGAMLLEIVLALALFLAAATIVLGGLSASLGAAKDLRLQITAQDLAVTVNSQLQMGYIAAVDAGPNPFDDPALEGWTWQVTITTAETAIQNASLRRAEVAIVNTAERITVRQVCVLSPELGAGGAGTIQSVSPPVSVPAGAGSSR